MHQDDNELLCSVSSSLWIEEVRHWEMAQCPGDGWQFIQQALLLSSVCVLSLQTLGQPPDCGPPIDPSPHPLLLLKVSTSVSTNVMRVTFLGKRPWPHYLSTTPMSCDQEV